MTSNINPNNIDGTYPVAGQDNNSQGFRDNFTNTKTNFQYASDEITDLQNNAILKAALAGTTLDNNMLGSLVYNGVIADFAATRVALGTVGGSQTINYALGHYQTITPSSSITLGFSNFPPSGQAGFLRLQITITSTAYTVTLPASVTLGLTGIQGLSGSTITFGSSGTYEFGFVTSNGGTNVTIFDLNRPLSYYTNPVTIASSTASGNTTSGALVVAGGAGIGGNLNVGGTFSISTFSASGNVTVGNVSTAGRVSATGNVYGGNVISSGLVSATSSIKSSSPTGGIGYATGAGNTVTQTSTRTSGVTINAASGAITLVSAAGNASYNTFTVTNSAVAATDVVIVNQKSGTDKYEAWVSNVAPGSFNITYADTSGTTTEQPVFNFAVIKAVTS